MAKKYYVVWVGRSTGIFTDWNTCKKQVDGFHGARYKSFKTHEEAEDAFGKTPRNYTKKDKSAVKSKSTLPTLGTEQVDNISVDTKIFTDGACDPNPGKAGSGIAIYRKNVISELWYGGYLSKGTNNIAELNALYKALMISKSELKKGMSVAIFCDSKYSIQCIVLWANSWEKNGWKKRSGEIKNLDLIKKIYTLYQSIKDSVQIFHVNGHVDIEGNELADRMSIYAIEKEEKDFCKYQDKIDIEQILSMRAG